MFFDARSQNIRLLGQKVPAKVDVAGIFYQNGAVAFGVFNVFANQAAAMGKDFCIGVYGAGHAQNKQCADKMDIEPENYQIETDDNRTENFGGDVQVFIFEFQVKQRNEAEKGQAAAEKYAECLQRADLQQGDAGFSEEYDAAAEDKVAAVDFQCKLFEFF